MLDRDSHRLEVAAGRFGGVPTHTDLARFLSTPGLQAVIVATPPDSHLDLALAALDHRLHTLVEKPMARTASECNRLVDCAKARQVALAVGHEKRFHPTFERVRELVSVGTIGDVFYCGVHWAASVKLDPKHMIPAGYESGYRWRWEQSSAGGGIIHDHLPHYVDLLRHWTKTEPEGVYAHTMNVARDRLDWPAETSVWEDFGLCIVRFSGNLLLRLETGVVGRSLSPIWSLGSGLGEWTEYGYMLGTRGQIVFDLLPWDSSENGRIALWELSSAAEGRGWTYIEQAEPARVAGSPAGASGAMFRHQLEAFAALIHGQPSEIAQGADGALAVAVVEAAYQSVSERREIAVPTAVLL
jgi:predicted dehydrogenase